MTTQTITMSMTKSTKGTHVYSNDDVDTPISSVYVKRSSLPNTPPPTIKLTVEYDD